MSDTLVLVDREVLREELRHAFDAATTEVLLRTLDKAAAQVVDAVVARDGLSEIKEGIKSLLHAGQSLELGQERQDAQLGRLDAALCELAEAQKRTEARVEELAEAQKRTEERLQILTERVDTLVVEVSRLTLSVSRLDDTVGKMKGQMLELSYARRPWAYFGVVLRKVHTVDLTTLEDTLRAHLTPGEFKDVFLTDLVLGGRPLDQPAREEVLVAMDISSVVDRNDVDRAERRVGWLRKAGLCAVPAVAGERVSQEAGSWAQERKVVLVQDGGITSWDEAMEFWGQ